MSDSCESSWVGPAAAERAGVTYRQLNYWYGLGYLTASAPPPPGRATAAFTSTDIARIAALLRAGQAGLTPAVVGPILVRLDIPDRPGFIVFTGRPPELGVAWTTETGLLELLRTVAGPHVVYDTTPHLAQAATTTRPAVPATTTRTRTSRRTA